MRRATGRLGGAITCMMAVTMIVAGGTGGAPAPLTVADFAAVLTGHGGPGTPADAEQAAQRLLRIGVPLGDPKAVLTEGRLAEIMVFYGVQATTSNPAALVSAERGGAAASILSALSLAGIEKRKGSPQTPGNPGDPDLGLCLSERNRGQCVNCCKNLGSPARACAHFCQNIDPHSPSAPR